MAQFTRPSFLSFNSRKTTVNLFRMKDKHKITGPDRSALTREVEEMALIVFHGNIVPPIWLRQILNKNGRVNPAAVMILADVVYWYRPAIARDEDTGRVVSYKRRFSGDFLRRSYPQIEAQFGFTERMIRLALDILERMDLVHSFTKPFRQGNMVQPNTLYLRPVPANIQALNDGAYLPGGKYGTNVEVSTVPTPESGRYLPGSSDITKNTTETSTQTSKPSASASPEKTITESDLLEFDEMDREGAAAAIAALDALRSKKEFPAGGIPAGEKWIDEPGEQAEGYIIQKAAAATLGATFDLERVYLEQIGLGAKVTVQQVASMMAYYFTKVETGIDYWTEARWSVGALEGELLAPALVCFPLASKSKQHQLQNWRSDLLPRLFNFMRFELETERGLNERREDRKNKTGKKPGQAAPAADDLTNYDYSENAGFDGK